VPEAGAQLEDGVVVRQAPHHRPHVVGLPAVLGDEVAQGGRVAGGPVVDRAAEVGQVLLGHRHGLGLVGHRYVDHAVGHLDGERADVLRRERAEPAALDHRRAAHAQVRPGGGDDDVAGAGEGGVAGEAPPVDDRHPRDQPAQPAPQPEGQAIEAGHAGRVGVAGAPAPALGEEHDRQAATLDDVEEPVLLAVVLEALRAGQDRVVVGQDGGRAPLHRADPGDQAVGRGPGDELVHRPAPALGGDGEGAVLDVAALVDEVGDVLAGGPVAPLVALGHHLRPGLVEPRPVPLDHLGEVGAQGRPRRGGRRRGGRLPVAARHRHAPPGGRPGRRRHGGRRGRQGRGRLGRLPVGDDGQEVAPLDLVAGGHGHPAHRPRPAGRDDVLHLHRLDDDDRRGLAHVVPGGRRHPHHDPLQRRTHLGHGDGSTVTAAARSS
jgi:hypothetical protein